MPPQKSHPPSLALRPAHPDDRSEAIRIQLEAFEPLTRAAWGMWDAARFEAGMWEDWRPEETRCVWIDGALSGFVRLSRRPTHDWLDLVVIAVQHQGKGAGGVVLSTLQEEATQRGVPLWLSVYRINPARRLYTRHGFSTHPRDPVRVLMGYPAEAVPPPELLEAGPTRS